MNPIYTAFFTRDSIYEQEVARLIKSLTAHGLPYDIRAIDNPSDWVLASRFTATHICNVLNAYPDRPVVQLDADAVVWKHPALFNDMCDVDIAVHYRKGVEMLNGTIYFAQTPAAKAVAHRYWHLIAANPDCKNEQTMLAQAIEEMPEVRVRRLPPSYCWIHDLMAEDLKDGEEVVIEHLQASRVATNSVRLPNRIKRLAEIGG